MSTILNTLNGIEDPDKLQLLATMSDHISKMPEEIRDRFKALKILYDECDELEDDRETELHKLEIQFEALYEDIYRQRNEVVNGTEALNQDLIDEFDIKAKELQKDPNYKDIEIALCDVKSTQNMPNGVAGFWVKAMCNHPNIS